MQPRISLKGKGPRSVSRQCLACLPLKWIGLFGRYLKLTKQWFPGTPGKKKINVRKSLRKVKKNLSKPFKKKQTPAIEGDNTGQEDGNVIDNELATADSAVEETGDVHVEEDVVEETSHVVESVSYEGLPAYNSTRGK